MWLWYLSHRRPAKAQTSLRIRAVSPEPLLFAHMNYGSRRRVRPKIRHLAPLDDWACVFEEWIYGGQKVPKSHELAHLWSVWVYGNGTVDQMRQCLKLESERNDSADKIGVDEIGIGEMGKWMTKVSTWSVWVHEKGIDRMGQHTKWKSRWNAKVDKMGIDETGIGWNGSRRNGTYEMLGK